MLLAASPPNLWSPSAGRSQTSPSRDSAYSRYQPTPCTLEGSSILEMLSSSASTSLYQSRQSPACSSQSTFGYTLLVAFSQGLSGTSSGFFGCFKGVPTCSFACSTRSTTLRSSSSKCAGSETLARGAADPDPGRTAAKPSPKTSLRKVPVEVRCLRGFICPESGWLR